MAKKTRAEPPGVTPDELMAGFSRTRFGPCIAIAILLHVLVIGATSAGYLYRFVSPEAEPRADSNHAADSSAKPNATQKTDAAAPAKADPDTKPAEKTEDPAKTGMTAAQKTSPVMQRITDTAKPDEIPKAPKGDLGLSIDETNSGK